MKLSIITVNLNNATGLQQTIDSVNTQTWQEFEHIIIDGDSTDGSKDIIQNYSHHLTISPSHPLKCVSESDSGVFQAMNKGIRLAQGEYLLFLNSGDFLVNKDVLSDIFKTSHTADFLLGSVKLSKDGKLVSYFHPPKQVTFGRIYYQGLSHQATLIKRNTFARFGLYREDFKYNADVEYWVRTIILNTCTTEIMDLLIADYNLDGISTQNNMSELYLQEKETIFNHPTLQLFIPDYVQFMNERKDLYIWNWLKSSPFLYKLIILLFKFYKHL